MSAQIVTVYTVRRSPYTAAAKRSAGYDSRDFEYVADGAKSALAKAVAECEWRDPESNFSWRVIGSRVIVCENSGGADATENHNEQEQGR